MWRCRYTAQRLAVTNVTHLHDPGGGAYGGDTFDGDESVVGASGSSEGDTQMSSKRKAAGASGRSETVTGSGTHETKGVEMKTKKSAAAKSTRGTEVEAGAPEGDGAPTNGGVYANRGTLLAAWLSLQPELSALVVEELEASPAETFKAFSAADKLLVRAKKPEVLARIAKQPADEVRPGLVEAFEAAIRAYQWVAIRPAGEEGGPKVDPELRARAEDLYERMYSVCAFTLEGNSKVEAALEALEGKKSYSGLIKGLFALAEIETEHAAILADQKFKHRASDPKDAVEVAEQVLAQVASSEAAPEQLRRAFTHMRRLYEEVAAVLYFFERRHRDAHFVPTLRAATRARRRAAAAGASNDAGKGDGKATKAGGTAGAGGTDKKAASAAASPPAVATNPSGTAAPSASSPPAVDADTPATATG